MKNFSSSWVVRWPATAVAMASFLSSCDWTGSTAADRDMVMAAPVHRLASHGPSEPKVLGSHDLEPPLQPAPNESDALAWRSTGIMADSGAWVRVRVSGGLLLSPNETYRERFNCGPTDDPCFPHNGKTVDALGLESNLYVKLKVEAGAPGSSGSFGTEIYLRRVLNDDGSSDGEAFFQMHRRGNVWVHRLAGWGTWSGADWIPKYTYAGSQTVTVRQVYPLQVHATKTFVDPNEAVTFETTIDGVVDLDSSAKPKIYWSYALLDTLSEPNGTYQRDITSCYGEETCLYEPESDLSGRMWVRAYIEGHAVQAQSQIVWVGRTPTLTVSCDPVPSVYREIVTCVAGSSPPGAQIENLSWGYSGGFDVVSQEGLTWWAALMSGDTVTASALVEGAAQGAKQLLEVSPCPVVPDRFNPDSVAFKSADQCKEVADVIAALRTLPGTNADAEVCRQLGENAYERFYKDRTYFWSPPIDLNNNGELDFGRAERHLGIGEVYLTDRAFEPGQARRTIPHEEAHLMDPEYPDRALWLPDGSFTRNEPGPGGRYADYWEDACNL